MGEKLRVFVMPKEGVFDPQGVAIHRAIERLGFVGIERVRTGRLIELDLVESVGAESAKAGKAVDIDAICKDLLANEVIENYHIERD